MSFIVKTQWPLSLGFEILMQILAAKSSEGEGEGPGEETLPLISTVSHFSSMLSWFSHLTRKMGESTSSAPSQWGVL